MVENRPTGRDQQIAEIPPTVLDCGHPYGPGLVVIGYEAHPVHKTRVRTYWCRECRATTYTEPD